MPDTIREQVKKDLRAAADPKYRKFHSKLIPGIEGIMGVRTPELRKLARKLVKDGWKDYIEEVSGAWKRDGQGEAGVYYDEMILWGLSICGGCRDWETAKSYVEEFVPAINNWAVCDIFCCSLKLTDIYKEEVWEFIQPCLLAEEEYKIRFGVVMLLNYFADQEHVKEALMAVEQIKHQGYYVKMAVAWAVSVYFVTCRETVMEYLKDSRLDQWTYNKALQKILESNRVDKETKARIRSMKRK